MKVSYPAIFYAEKEGNYTAIFPDFDQATCGDDLDDAVFMAKDLLSLWVTIYFEDHKELPKPTALEEVDIHCEDDDDWEYVRAFVKMIEVEVEVPQGKGK